MKLAASSGAWIRVFSGICLLAVAAWVFWAAQRQFRADWGSAEARFRVAQWAGHQGAPAGGQAQWQQVVQSLQRALGITPLDPKLHERLGDAHYAAGQRDWEDLELRRLHFANAVLAYETSVKLRPSEPGTWVLLAAARQIAGAPAEQVLAAWQNAARLGPHEGHVQPVLMQVALTDWDNADPAMQAWAKALYQSSSEPIRKQINALAREFGLVFSADENLPAGDGAARAVPSKP